MRKQCTKCRAVKLARNFSRDSRRKDGLGSWCKSCKKVQVDAWQARNKPKRNSQARGRYASIPKVRTDTAARVKRWKDGNKEHWRELKREQSKRRRHRAKELKAEAEQ